MSTQSYPIPLAVRVYPEPMTPARKPSASTPWNRPQSMLVFDTETTMDPTQRLLFGSYRFIVNGQCHEEGLFHADDLTRKELAILESYVKRHPADTVNERQLKLITQAEFLKKLFAAVYKGRSLLVGFNLPFDLSRLGFEVSTARGHFAGGFSLGLWHYRDEKGAERLDPNRPRITIKHIDSKRSLMSFKGRMGVDPVDQIPEGSTDGAPQKGYRFQGHFLDLKTLVFAMTNQSHSLDSACQTFGVERGKMKISKHGEITEEYIDYNRRDVDATAQLAIKLIEEYSQHPISLPETKALSQASIGKAYLKAMGITPIIQRQPSLQPHIGYAQTAYFGGRTSAHIRKIPVPVVYVDFLSMYPTVNSLMNMWQFVIAREIKIVDHCHHEIIEFLKSVTREMLFEPDSWKHLAAFVRVIPDGDILPTRGRYSSASNDWQVALNHLYAAGPDDALWFSLPDVVAAVLLTGRVPKIVDAFRIEPFGGLLEGLKPVKLYGGLQIDPRNQDFFRVVIEERKRIDSRTDLDTQERKKRSKPLKDLANTTSYGIYAQMVLQERQNPTYVTCHGIDRSPYACKVTKFETAGEFSFPPMASLITGAARLMLALLECCVTDLGGTYAMEDTDSMAIVATPRGGLVPCQGGKSKHRAGSGAIKALT
jgi:hypothetical protein